MTRWWLPIVLLVCTGCTQRQPLTPLQCGPWGTPSAELPVALSDSTFRAATRRDSALLAQLSMQPSTIRSLLQRARAEPKLFRSAVEAERLVCVSKNGDDKVNVNVFFRYPNGRGSRTDQYKDQELLGLTWVKTDRWRLMTWTLWSRY